MNVLFPEGSIKHLMLSPANWPNLILHYDAAGALVLSEFWAKAQFSSPRLPSTPLTQSSSPVPRALPESCTACLMQTLPLLSISEISFDSKSEVLKYWFAKVIRSKWRWCSCWEALWGQLGNLLYPDSRESPGECIHCSLLACKLMRPGMQPGLPSAVWDWEFRGHADFCSESCSLSASLT